MVISGGRTGVGEESAMLKTQANFEEEKLKTNHTKGKIFCMQ